jgi:co-chaperonin GroES (HSP10)
MKAVNDVLIIEKRKAETKKVGGLLLTEKLDEDNRYLKATVISSGDRIDFIKKGDTIYYDKHAGHGISLNDKLYQVIRIKDVVIVE